MYYKVRENCMGSQMRAVPICPAPAVGIGCAPFCATTPAMPSPNLTVMVRPSSAGPVLPLQSHSAHSAAQHSKCHCSTAGVRTGTHRHTPKPASMTLLTSARPLQQAELYRSDITTCICLQISTHLSSWRASMMRKSVTRSHSRSSKATCRTLSIAACMSSSFVSVLMSWIA
jgi:hypothetical protein